MNNYARFYQLLAQIHYPGDRQELKESIVLQFTNSRTSHLHEMRPAEYAAACQRLELITGYRDKLRRERSITLHLLQLLGINTASWACVNLFVSNPRIYGRPFRAIPLKDHPPLQRRLRALARKGYRADKPRQPSAPTAPTIVFNPDTLAEA